MPIPVEKLYVTIPYRGYLAPLKMMGPIAHPLKINKDDAVKLVLSGVKVYSYDPETKATAEVTLAGLTGKEAATAPKISPAVSPTPISGVKTPAPVMTMAEEPDPIPTEPEAPVTDTEDKNQLVETSETSDVTPELIDESTIDWSKMTKAERKAMRQKLEAQKASTNEVTQ